MPPGTAKHGIHQLGLLRTKLSPPAREAGLIPRSRLDEWSRRSASAKLTLIRAPAGFGKTTLMLQLFRRLKEGGKPAVWLTLDDGDNDAVRFVAHVGAAFQLAVPASEAGALPLAEPGGGTLTSGLLLSLLDWAASCELPYTLFLDDFDAIRTQEVCVVVGKLLDHLPPDWHVVISTRESPALPLSRMRAQRQLVEIGAEDLRFALDETQQFLLSESRLDLDDADLARLHRCTEGWAAGLQLVALALAHREDRKAFIRSFSGSSRSIADYLAEQVLSRQPEEVREFLLKTSILARLSGPLCDALTGRADGYEMLARLEEANLFLAPLDDEGLWYRYHNLFAQFLRSRLERGSHGQVAALHRAASEWFSASGEFVHAAEHSLSAGDPERAAELMGRCAKSLFNLGQVSTVVDWAERLPADARNRQPEMQLAYGWALSFRHRFDEARAILDQISTKDLSDLGPTVQDQVRALQPIPPLFADRIEESHRLAAENLPKISRRNAFEYGALANVLGFCLISSGEFDEAERVLRGSWERGAGNSLGSLYSECLRGLLRLAQGRLQEALSFYRTAQARAKESFAVYSLARAVTAAFLGEALYELGELDEAEELLAEHLPVIREYRPVEPIIFSYRTVARVHAARGRDEEALRILEEAEGVGRNTGAMRLVATMHLERTWLALRRGDARAALRMAQQFDDTGIWKSNEGRVMPANTPETPAVSHLRLAIRTGRAGEALPRLRAELDKAQTGLRFREALGIRILEAEALEVGGETKKALRVLKEALRFAAREGYVQVFADEGETVTRLLQQVRDAHSQEDDTSAAEVDGKHLDRILVAIAPDGPRALPPTGPEVDSTPMEALTQREVEILRLAALGLSNQQMANRLFLSLGTVKFHLRNINSKLGAENRTQASAKARQLGLIS
ncbi:MAG: tetratricopeptide repeat protein [Deltaproteobacteria bacterium]|nr:tetratricopeptide repeat protein [Deltaproteobacteria bacterium]